MKIPNALTAAVLGLALTVSTLGGCASQTPTTTNDKGPYGQTTDQPFAPNDLDLMDPNKVYRTMPPGE